MHALKYLSHGATPGLQEVLANREKRVQRMTELKEEFPEATIICYKLNIPGPVKNNNYIEEIFFEGLTPIKEGLSEAEIPLLYEEEVHRRTGSELFLVCEAEGEAVKRLMLDIEETHHYGRLFDIDVETARETISRQDLAWPERSCFLCDKPAKECARSRTHSVEEMLIWIEQLIEERKRNVNQESI